MEFNSGFKGLMVPSKFPQWK